MTIAIAICVLTCALLVAQEMKLWRNGNKRQFAAVLLFGVAVMGLTIQQARTTARKEAESAERERRSDDAAKASELREKASDERSKKSEERAEQTARTLEVIRDAYVTNGLITVIELDETEASSAQLSDEQKQAQLRLAAFAQPELETRCRKKDLQACKVLYRDAKAARADERNDVATHLFDVSCNGGVDWACQNVGTYYLGRRDYEKALHYYALGCSLKLEKACEHKELAKRQRGG